MGLLAVDLTNRIPELQPVSKKALPANQRKGVSFPKYFTQKLEAGKTPYDEIAWELRTAAIGNDKGAIIFEQNDVEVPADWSQTATNIVVSKYFLRQDGVAGAREQRPPAGASRGGHHRRLGRARALLQDPRRRGEFPQRAGAPDADAEGLLQFAGLVQRGRHGTARLRLLLRRSHGQHREAEEGRIAPAVLGLLHQLGEGFAGIHSRSGQDRRHAVQVGIGHRHQSFAVARRGRPIWQAAARHPVRSAS